MEWLALVLVQSEALQKLTSQAVLLKPVHLPLPDTCWQFPVGHVDTDFNGMQLSLLLAQHPHNHTLRLSMAGAPAMLLIS